MVRKTVVTSQVCAYDVYICRSGGPEQMTHGAVYMADKRAFLLKDTTDAGDAGDQDGPSSILAWIQGVSKHHRDRSSGATLRGHREIRTRGGHKEREAITNHHVIRL